MGKFGTRPDLTRQARASIEAGQPRDAKKLLQEAIDVSRGDGEAWALLAVCHGMLGEYIECERCCRRAIEVEPRALGPWDNLGSALKFQGRIAEAERAYRKALKIDPRYTEGYNNLGNLLLERKEFEEAERCYRQALALQPGNLEVISNLGTVYQAQGKIEEAIAYYQRVLAVQPQHANALTNLGTAYIALGKKAEAMGVFEHAVSFQPENVKAWWALGDLYQQVQAYDRAIECSNRVLTINPDYAASYYTLALCYKGLNDYDRAEKMFRKAHALDPKGMENVHYFLAAIGREPLPEKAPANYLKELFDDYAVRFDRHLVVKLAYQAPKLLNAAVRAVIADPSIKLDILDLGCGTGLSGEPFRDIAQRLTGVDLSPKMISKAKARAIYDELIVGDILTPLVRPDAAFDLIIAADVFIYFGDLAPVFRACKTALRSGGLFAFSTEAEDGDGTYVLRASGRYAHTLSYLHALAESAGFTMVTTERAIVRKELEKDIEGNICVVRHKMI